ncbi:hypothetical protein PG993_013356 [Apiospora rasikravindrae]|uniref:Uncharacterized protein n=1 Tax=Apiospora rasikravindrae TaxID=990691 RepID=A0ABR1RXE7_9PEZI
MYSGVPVPFQTIVTSTHPCSSLHTTNIYDTNPSYIPPSRYYGPRRQRGAVLPPPSRGLVALRDAEQRKREQQKRAQQQRPKYDMNPWASSRRPLKLLRDSDYFSRDGDCLSPPADTPESTQARREALEDFWDRMDTRAPRTRSSISVVEDYNTIGTRKKASRSLRRRMRDWRARMRSKKTKPDVNEPKPATPSQAVALRPSSAQPLLTPPSLAARWSPAYNLRSPSPFGDSWFIPRRPLSVKFDTGSNNRRPRAVTFDTGNNNDGKKNSDGKKNTKVDKGKQPEDREGSTQE